eukprot:scaffold50957_cov17-Tisochrysis_lutea.AAC.1
MPGTAAVISDLTVSPAKSGNTAATPGAVALSISTGLVHHLQQQLHVPGPQGEWHHCFPFLSFQRKEGKGNIT